MHLQIQTEWQRHRKHMEIKELITDVDGVLTDGKYFYSEDGKVLKQFGPHDSDGFKIIRSLGIRIQAISADHRGFKITEKRLNDMGIEVHLVSEEERLDWVVNNCEVEKTVFVGDGLYDAAAMRMCALSFAPSNALASTKSAATYITEAAGGSGVMFDVALRLVKNIDPLRYEKLIRGDTSG